MSDVKLKLKTMSQVSSNSYSKKKRKLSFIASTTCKSEEQGSIKYKGGATFAKKESDTESDPNNKPASLVVASQVRTSIGKWAKKQPCTVKKERAMHTKYCVLRLSHLEHLIWCEVMPNIWCVFYAKLGVLSHQLSVLSH